MSHQYQSTADLQALVPALLNAIIERSDSMNDHTLCMWLQEDPIVGSLKALAPQDIAFVREGVRQLATARVSQ